MELDELQILQRKSSTDDHSVTISRASVGTCAAEVGSSVTTGSQNGLVRTEAVQGTVFHVERNDTDTLAVLHDQVQREVLDEEVRVVAQRLAVESVENGVSSSVSGSGATVGLATLAVLEGLSTEGALVNLAFLGSGEGNTVVLELRLE